MPATASRTEESRREAGLSPPAPARERWRHAARLIGCWWFSREWKFAWGTLLLLFAISSSGIVISIWSNRWQQQFFDSIQYRRAGLFGALVVSFLLILASQVGMSLARTFVDQMIRLRWRTFLTARYLDRWFARDRYYEIERLRLIDNPDQRIADDINLLTWRTHGLFVGFVTTTAGAISFSVILMETAQAIRFDLLGSQVAVPGDLVIYAWAYALLGSAMIVLIGRPFVRRTMREQHYEADFRAGLIHVRRHAAQVSFAGAQPVERRSLGAMFANIQRNFFRLVLADMGIKLGSETYERVAGIIPLIVTVPRFFTGAISFGQVMGARDAFGQLVGQLSYFVQAYGEIGKQIANVNRLKALDDAIDDRRPRGIAFSPGDAGAGVALATRGLVLAWPNGAVLADIGDWEVAERTRWVVQGASGAGKSTLLRALAGLWPDGRGSVAMAGGRLTMLVPQRLYLPLGTLKDAVCFPDEAAAHEDAVILDLLDVVGLAAHRDHIHESRMWQDELSPGEQQRVALARILLHRPALLVLDEATSALDPAGAQHFYRTLLDRLPMLTLVSVVHDEGLTRFHTHRLDIADGVATLAAVA